MISQKLFRTRFALPILLGGCATLGPDFVEPEQNLATRFVEGSSLSIENVAGQAWWLGLNDPMLNGLIEQGQISNLSIRTAVLRIADAREEASVAGVPTLLSGVFSSNHLAAGSDLVATTATSSQSLNLGFDFDIFGGNRRNRERALANLDSSRFNLGTTRQIFMSNLVTQYIQARYYQELMAVTRIVISSRRQTLVLVEQQLAAGEVLRLDVDRTVAQLEEARASLPSQETGFNNAVYAIATLLAKPAGPIIAELSRGARQPLPRGSTSVGIPADLLRNRPDVRAAERNYTAASAGIGVAEAAMYPSLSLSGNITTAAITSWSYGPSVIFPILNQPLLKSNKRRAVIQFEQAELAWRSTVLSAVEEVQSAQSSLSRLYRAARSNEASVRANAKVADLSLKIYSEGASTLLDLLDAQRAHETARLSLATVYRDLALNFASLQIAAGHGWQL